MITLTCMLNSVSALILTFVYMTLKVLYCVSLKTLCCKQAFKWTNIFSTCCCCYIFLFLIKVSVSNKRIFSGMISSSVTFWPLLLQEFTLEFSRDRKSMSVYCSPRIDGPNSVHEKNPKMFVKVKRSEGLISCILCVTTLRYPVATAINLA